MTSKVGPKGQVVIPKELRDKLNIQPGDQMEFWDEGEQVVARKAKPRTPLLGRFAGSGMAEELLRERAADREREDRR